MADKWSSIVAKDKSGHSATIDVSAWLGKATLDAYVQALVIGVCQGLIAGPPPNRIGAAAFEYDFGALDDTGDPFTKSYTNLLYDHLPSSSTIQGSRHANLLCSLALHPSETPLDRSFSSWPSRNGSQGCSHGYMITPAILECRTSDGTETKGASSLGSCSIQKGRS